MRSRKAFAGAAAALLLLAACSDPQGTEPGEAAATAGEDATAAPDASGADGKGSGGPGGRKQNGSGAGGSSARGGREGGDGRAGGSGSGNGGSFAGSTRGSTGYPSAGDYVYAQDGWEKFCQGPNCSKEPLPETATTTASYSDRSQDAATIVTETQSSPQQKLTATTRYTAAKALITRVVIEFNYSGFNFSQSYEPRPPVESLLFPLSAHDGWRGRWKARTSGDYRVEVAGREDVSVGGRTISAYRLETVTNFRGDFSGRAQMSVWIDPDTAMVLGTDGEIAVASAFGEYTSNFRTTLRSGPGY